MHLKILVHISVRGWVDPQGHNAAGSKKFQWHHREFFFFEPVTFQLAAQCLNQLRHRVCPFHAVSSIIYCNFVKLTWTDTADDDVSVDVGHFAN